MEIRRSLNTRRDLIAASIMMLTGWGQGLVALGEILADVFAVVSKPPRIGELR